MGLPQFMYGSVFDRDQEDRSLTIDDIAYGRDISDSALVASVWEAPHQVVQRRSHFDNGLRRRSVGGNSDADLMRELFED